MRERSLLEMRGIYKSFPGVKALQNVDFTLCEGEIHALMGRNGAGKSTLSAVLTGNPAYTVTEGSITFNGKDMLSLTPDQRANEGLFLSFQYPVEIPGVSMVNFLKAAVNAKRQYQGLEPLSAIEFLRLKREKEKLLEITAGMQNRSVNEGFSGGEKKKNEVFQMAMLQPSLAILDETDSGLDVDALRIVADGFNKIRTPQMSAIIITHYERMLDYIRPDFVHVLYGGTIVETGDATLAKQIDERGFDWIEDKYKP